MYQLKVAKLDTEKQTEGVDGLKQANADLQKKIKRYISLIEEAKIANEKAAADGVVTEDLNEFSVTRKLGHTDMGDISDILERGSALYKSIDGRGEYTSRAIIDEHPSQIAIKRLDYGNFGNESFDDRVQQNREDLSDRSHITTNINHTKTLKDGLINLSSSLVANTAASVHLRNAMAEMKDQKPNEKRNLSPPRRNIDFRRESTIIGESGRDNSLDAASKIAVQKMPTGTNVDVKKLGSLLEKLPKKILAQERCIDAVLNFLNELCKACGYTKATMYALSPIMKQTMRKNAKKEHSKYLNMVPYMDRGTGSSEKLVGVAPVGLLCQSVVFDSV